MPSKQKNNSIYKILSIVFAVIIIIALVFLVLDFSNNSNAKNTQSNLSGSNKNIANNTINNSNKNNNSKMYENVLLETNLGNITIQLNFNASPITSANFKKLVEQGFYDGTRFHRVIKNFMIQGGDPLSKNLSDKNIWGTGGPGYTIADEFDNGLSNTRGTIAMANTGRPHSAGSQFFINTVNNSAHLDGGYTVFGKVISGMDVVDKISNVKTDSTDKPIQSVIIEKAVMLN